MADLPSLASSGSLTTMVKAQDAQKLLAAQLINGLEQSSQSVRSAAPNRVDTVQISQQAQQLYDAALTGG